MSKFFTRDEAERVLPEVEQLLREALHLKSQYVDADEVLKATVREITMRGGMSVNNEPLGRPGSDGTRRPRDCQP